ncbi:TrmH family RNA methyltransferase [Actinomyces slackii]|uniref:23S rRNA methyltransferase n=1 Tax=Actinomyces slackii TaxID=52774 RepID=A0A3S4SS08_9ACTO|nr:TrmH family RNA methyltransferase [Actinomyces slackii]VEG73688.1 23S rRNA methyltransferase [Actinomyces slackii]
MTEHSPYPAIMDRSAPAAQRIADLAKVSGSPGKSVLIEDEEPLLNALRAGLDIQEVYVLDSVDVPQAVAQECLQARIPLTIMSASLATELFRSDKRPDVFGLARVPRPVRAQRLRACDRDLVILDGVRIPGNIGAIIRSAHAFGAAGVVLVDSGLKSIADRRLIRASRGYVFSLPVALMSWAQVRDLIDEADMEVISLDAGGQASLEEVAPRAQRIALLLGAETVGLSDQARQIADLTVSITMNEAVESLNVSVTAGVLLHARSPRNLALLRSEPAR